MLLEWARDELVEHGAEEHDGGGHGGVGREEGGWGWHVC